MSRTWSSLLITVWFATLFGIAAPWAWKIALLLIFVSLILVVMLHQGSNIWRPPGFAPLAGWLIFLLLQYIPLPPVLLSFLAPGTHRLYTETLWVLNPGSWAPLAVVVKPAVLGLLQLWTVAGLFWITVQTGADHTSLGKLMRWFGLAIGGLALGLLGYLLFDLWLGNEQVIGAATVEKGANCFAALVPLVLACHLYARPRKLYGPWLTRLRQALRRPGSCFHGYLFASAVAMCLFVLFFGNLRTQISLVGGLLFLSICVLLRQGIRRAGTGVMVLTLLLLIVVGLGTRHTGTASTTPAVAPPPVAVERQDLVRDFLLFGAGPGNHPALEERYTRVVAETAGRDTEFFAIPLLVEGGLVGVILTLWFWISILLVGVAGWIRRRNRLSWFFLPGVVAGLLICFASGYDPMQAAFLWPGTTGYFLAALLVAFTCFNSSGEADFSMAPMGEAERRVILFFAGILTVGAAAFLCGQSMLRPLAAESATVLVPATADRGTPDVRYALRNNLFLDPLEADHWYAAGIYWADQREDKKAVALFRCALRLNPLAGKALYRLGAMLESRDYPEAGPKLMLAALENDSTDASLWRDHLLYLLSANETAQAMSVLSGLLLLDPEETGLWLHYLETHQVSQQIWQPHLPLRANVYRQYGDFLAARNLEEKADTAYLQAVRWAADEPWVSAEMFRHIAAYFVERSRYETALEVLRDGLQARPENLDLLLAAGDLYRRLGITYRAAELYRKAMLLAPDMPEVRTRLENL